MVGRRDTGHRGQGDVRHGSHFKDMHKNPNEHVATCMGPNPNWHLVWPTPISPWLTFRRCDFPSPQPACHQGTMKEEGATNGFSRAWSARHRLVLRSMLC